MVAKEGKVFFPNFVSGTLISRAFCARSVRGDVRAVHGTVECGGVIIVFSSDGE